MVYTTRNSKSCWSLAKLSILTIAVALASIRVSAQDATGIISGSLVDAEFGGGVSDALISFVETNLTTKTDKDGRFLLSNVPEGEYTLLASALFFKSSSVQELQVVAGEVIRIDVPMYGDDSDIVELDSFSVKAKALEGSNLALLSQRQKSSSISDAIGSESFGRLGIGDAADALSKTTGVSIADGKYMVIRGLSDRYNNTTLNGSTVPSADPDKRAVQLDQFPSDIIESIVTTKSFTPDKAGNFTGGSVDVVTKSVPPAGFMSYSIGFGYNEKTTFDDYLTYGGGGKDWLGYDDGTRAIPDGVLEATSQLPLRPNGQPDEVLALFDSVSRAFEHDLAPRLEEAPLNHSLSVSFGERYPLADPVDGPVLGIIGNVNYSRSYSAYDDGVVGRYEVTAFGDVVERQTFVEAKGTDSAQLGATFSAALIFGSNHEFGLKSAYNQSGEDDAIFRVGSFDEAVADDTFQVRNLHYTERFLLLNQAYGEHKFDSLNGARLNWELSSSTSKQEEPDFRILYDAIPSSGIGGTIGGNVPQPRRYWRELEEKTDEFKFDFTMPFGKADSEVKVGVLTSDTSRGFEEQSFIYGSNISYQGDPFDYFQRSNIGLDSEGELQIYINQFVGPVPSYDGDQSIDAVYAMIDFRPSENWRVITGSRLEEADIAVQSFDSRGNPSANDGDLSNSDWLPALQVVREFGENQNLRVSYSRAIARPNFRELSPFGSFDNIGGEVFIGNPDLVRTRIQNLDVRYEIYGEGTDLVALSLFGKRLEDPIEQAILEGQQTFVNVDEGEVYGIELESRRLLKMFSGDKNEFSVGGNLSLIESNVDRSERELKDKIAFNRATSPQRELQGQSGLIGNFNIYWVRPVQGSSFSLVYNHTGERLYSVSQRALPDVYELGSDNLDFIYSQSLPMGYRLKLSLKNLLDDSRTLVWRDIEEDLIFSDVEKGRSISLSFSKRFD